MEKIRFNLINMLLLLTLVSFTACKQEDDNVPSGEKSLVTIRTYLSAPVGTLPTRTGTRATEVLPDGEKHYTDPYNDLENKVTTVRLFACLGDKVVKNILYVRSRATYTASAGEIVKEFQPGRDTRSFSMDIELMPDTYTFVLVANEKSLATSTPVNFSSITTKSQVEEIMVAPSTITSNKDLAKPNYTGIPMVGEQQITVPKGKYDATNRWVATPAIKLERTLAKVEFYLKNTDDSGRKFPKNAFPENEFSEFKSLKLIKANPSYRLMKDETINDGMTELPNDVLSGTHFGKQEFNNFTPKNDNGYAQGKQYDPDKEIVWYMNPRAGVTAGNATTIVLTVEHTKTDETAKEFEIKVPLYQTLNEEKVYDIKRNTIYRIYGTLKGVRFDYKVYVVVKDWVKKDKGNENFSFGGSEGL